VLTIIVGAVPAILWHINGTPLPDTWPDVNRVWVFLSRRDDGSFFLDVLIFIGWSGWGTFVISVLAEVLATARGVVAPSLPGLGAQQRIVAALITAITALVPATGVAAADTSTASQMTIMSSHGPWDPAPPVTTDLLNEREQHPTTTDNNRPVPSKTAVEYEVAPGDSLWTIAEAKLADPSRYREIFDASVTVRQPNGQRLTQPDLILPGWTLMIPGRGTIDERPSDVSSRSHQGRASSSTTQLPSTGGNPDLVSPDQFKPADAIGNRSNLVECHEVDALQGNDKLARSDDVDDDTDVSAVVRTSSGIGAVLAAGLVGVLAMRRTQRQRRRHAGEHVISDIPVDRATEVELRHTADPAGVEFADRALRTLLARLASRNLALPPLRAVRLTDATLELYLATPAVLPQPFTGNAEHTVWTVPIGSNEVLDTTQARAYPAPYPALVTLGHDNENACLLVDLEHFGALTINGQPEVGQAVLTAMAAEYATSRWVDDIRVTLVGGSHSTDLVELETGRVRRVVNVDRLLDELVVRDIDDRRLLAQTEAEELNAARMQQKAGATWTPDILLIADPLSAEHHQRLTALLTRTPRIAIAAVVRHQASQEGWALSVTGSIAEPTAILHPIGIRIRPQVLSTSTFAHICGLLRSTDGSAAADADPNTRNSHVERTPAGPARNLVNVSGSADSSAVGLPEPRLPRLIMLGPVEVIQAAELGEPNKLGQLTELAMFIALNPGCDTETIDEAIWPGSAVTRTTRNTAISKLRRWLGTDPSGAPLLPRTEGGYTLRAIRSDWDDWRSLVGKNPADLTQVSTPDLWAALALVQGRPLSGRGRRRYAWVDHHAQEMITAIVDVCHEAARRSLGEGSPADALRASLLGLSVEPAVELLWRDRLMAEVMLGDRATVLASIDKLYNILDDLGGDLQEDTVTLINQILGQQRNRSTHDAA
jgi:hypothetical protein